MKKEISKWADENCPHCHGTGVVEFGHFDEEEEKVCICVKNNKADYDGETLSDFERGN